MTSISMGRPATHIDHPPSMKNALETVNFPCILIQKNCILKITYVWSFPFHSPEGQAAGRMPAERQGLVARGEFRVHEQGISLQELPFKGREIGISPSHN